MSLFEVRVLSEDFVLGHARAKPNATVTGLDELPGKSNCLIGNDQAKWLGSQFITSIELQWVLEPAPLKGTLGAGTTSLP